MQWLQDFQSKENLRIATCFLLSHLSLLPVGHCVLQNLPYFFLCTDQTKTNLFTVDVWLLQSTFLQEFMPFLHIVKTDKKYREMLLAYKEVLGPHSRSCK
jgi:hypothetical protein